MTPRFVDLLKQGWSGVRGLVARGARLLRARAPFLGSASYWEHRYRDGGNSGDGSHGQLARFKAEILNGFVADHAIRTVLELGCGDGHQLSLATYPSYLGFDVSRTALAQCKARFDGDASKRFRLESDYAGERAELALSIDVIYHLVEDEVFERHLRRLFDAAERFVIIYSSNFDRRTAAHVRHRAFTRWVEAHVRGWHLVESIPNRHPFTGDNASGSLADFYVYARG